MQIPIYQVDAFTNRLFAGNPAAVCLLESWLQDDILQAVAAENNLSETAFLVPGPHHYDLRWFTPKTEVDLCGHATLASAHVIFHCLNSPLSEVAFSTRSGRLTVCRDGARLVMDFPSRPGTPCEAPAGLLQGLGVSPLEVYRSRDYLVVLPSETDVRGVNPDFDTLSGLDALGVIVTAPGDQVDFVSRFFAPGEGIPEDPVTGSAHCTLVPYWAARLEKRRLHALQVSARGGELFCEDRGGRVRIAGNAVVFMVGQISL